MIGTARDHSARSLSRLDISPVAKDPDLSSSLVIFEFKAFCCIIRLWKFTPMAEATLLKWLLEVSQQLNPALFMLPVWLSFTFTISATTLTHSDTHADEWNLRESFLSLLKEENDNVKDSKHPRWVSHMKIILMALQWLKFSVFNGLRVECLTIPI